MDKGDDPYQILGLSSNEATEDEIKKAYRKLALKHHPDRPTGDHALFSKISNAYEILSDPEERRNYDLQQQHGIQGFDPNGPRFSSTASPSSTSSSKPTSTSTKPKSGKTSNKTKTYTTTTTSSSSPSSSTTYTTTSSSPNSTKTYTTTTTTTSTTSSKPKRSTTSTKSSPMTYTYSGNSFQDPYELFKKHFGEEAAADMLRSNSGIAPTSSTTKKKKSKPVGTTLTTTNSSSNPTDGDNVMGMSSSTRTVTHPNGQKELITETIITKFDGTTEKRIESKMIGSGNITPTTMRGMGMPTTTTGTTKTYSTMPKTMRKPTTTNTTMMKSGTTKKPSSSSSKPMKTSTTMTMTSYY